jgi:DNA-binding response OmpR family regulator
MNHKVLLADDSPTIQKVIKITLANQPYDITDCSSEEELFQQLPVVQPKIVFLDFNLSEKYTGYELTTKIKSLSPHTKVLLLLGTFDSVEDSAIQKCGASDKIVKPFDSNKFIAICKQLSQAFEDKEENESVNSGEEDEVGLDLDSDDQWQVTHTSEVSLPATHEVAAESRTSLDPLAQEMNDWGMSVPGIIGRPEVTSSMSDLPPVIGEKTSSNIAFLNEQRIKAESTATEIKFPQNEDLDYPTMEELTAAPIKVQRPVNEAPSKLVPINAMNEDKIELEFEDLHSSNESDVSIIEEQIRDEVEESLWQADEFEELKREVSSKIEEMKNDFQPPKEAFDESLFRPLDENESIDWSSSFTGPDASSTASQVQLDMNQIRSEMEAMVKKYVQEYMDQMFQKNVEKVSWEVIPDLAENLIRQELQKISHKILNDQ